MDLSQKKKHLTDLIENNNKSIQFYKPETSSKSSAVWESFSVIVNILWQNINVYANVMETI